MAATCLHHPLEYTTSPGLPSCFSAAAVGPAGTACVLQVTPLVIDDSLQAMAGIIADVRGWTLQEAAERLADNFRRFYQDQL